MSGIASIAAVIVIAQSANQPLCDRAAALQKLLAPIRRAKWVVYAKPPFGGPQRVFEYLGRYTHRTAISNHRLQHWDKLVRSHFRGRTIASRARARWEP